MKWNPHRRWDAINELAHAHPQVAADWEKHAKPDLVVPMELKGHVLAVEIDLHEAIVPQLEQVEVEALWRQHKIEPKLKRSTRRRAGREQDKDFVTGLRVVRMRGGGASWQEIGDAVWRKDFEPEGRRSKARRAYRRALSTPRNRPKLRLVKMSRRNRGDVGNRL